MLRISADTPEPAAPGPPALSGPSVQPARFTPPTKRRAVLRLDVASLDALEDAALALDESGYITYCNLAAEQLYRVDRAAMLGRPYRELVDEHPCVIDEGERSPAQQTGERLHLTDGREMHVAAGERRIPVHVTLIPFGPIGGPRRHIVIVRDDRTMQALAASLEEELKFERFISAMSTQFCRLTDDETDAEIEEWLRRLVELLDIDRSCFAEILPSGVQFTHSYAAPGIPHQPPLLTGEQVPWLAGEVTQGRSVVVPRLPDDLPDAARIDRHYFTEQGMKSGVAIPISIGGNVVCVLTAASFRGPREWPADVVSRLALVGDVFANALVRRQAKQRLEQKQQELAHVGRAAAMGQLASVIAHELDQPLTAVVSNAQAVRYFLESKKPDLVEVDAALKDIVDAGMRVAEIVRRERRLMTRSERELVGVDLNEVIREIELFIRADARRAQTQLSFDLVPGLPTVLADRVQFQQVILNLTHNGLQAMSGQARARRALLIRTQSTSKEVVVSVSDRGPAIDDERLRQMFEPFFTTKRDGLGMGLSIGKTIVESHRGRIWASRNSDTGLTVHISIPQERTIHVHQ